MTAASRAIEAILAALTDSEIAATRDAGAFDPSPVGILVGLPSLVSWTLSGWRFDVPITVVTSDPLNTPAAVDDVYAAADAVAFAVNTLGYRPTQWAGSSRAEPLFALEIIASLTVSIQED